MSIDLFKARVVELKIIAAVIHEVILIICNGWWLGGHCCCKGRHEARYVMGIRELPSSVGRPEASGQHAHLIARIIIVSELVEEPVTDPKGCSTTGVSYLGHCLGYGFLHVISSSVEEIVRSSH